MTNEHGNEFYTGGSLSRPLRRYIVRVILPQRTVYTSSYLSTLWYTLR